MSKHTLQKDTIKHVVIYSHNKTGKYVFTESYLLTKKFLFFLLERLLSLKHYSSFILGLTGSSKSVMNKTIITTFSLKTKPQIKIWNSTTPQDVLGYFRELKSPYLRIGTWITYNVYYDDISIDVNLVKISYTFYRF